jgi:hypothetical protein
VLCLLVCVGWRSGLASFEAGVASADTAPAMIGATNTSVTYDCGNQPSIVINGANAAVTLTGTNNAVHLETVVTSQSGPGGAAPQISNTGIHNVFNQR